MRFQSTPSAWRETCIGSSLADSLCISIHSLRMEGDSIRSRIPNTHDLISIHSLRMEEDRIRIIVPVYLVEFQSTPSAWRETANFCIFIVAFFISIHSLRMEGDPTFLVFRPVRQFISIHSLRMEGDAQLETIAFERLYFNPLPPHGGRQSGAVMSQVTVIFQSTPSAWRETRRRFASKCFLEISIHSLRMEGDFSFVWYALTSFEFQSTPSAWRETTSGNTRVPTFDISIHSLRMEGDFLSSNSRLCNFNFNPLPPHGGRHRSFRLISDWIRISIHSLRMEGDREILCCISSCYRISIHSLRMEGD